MRAPKLPPVTDAVALRAAATAPDPRVRLAVAEGVPFAVAGTPGAAAVTVLVTLLCDPHPTVRERACFAFASPWRDVDAPGLTDALAALLDDGQPAAAEAVLALAHRHDDRARPAVREALAAAPGEHSALVLEAAGVLGDPGLHRLVRAHADACEDADLEDEPDLDLVDAVLRLTDPAGVGDDLLDGVAELCRRRAHGRPDGRALAAWGELDAALDLAPHRAPAVLADVAERLADDDAAREHLLHRSALARLAASVGGRTLVLDGQLSPGRPAATDRGGAPAPVGAGAR